MRIALISYEYPPETGFGGIGTYTHYHARALSRLGHEVHVFAGTQKAERRTYRDGHVTVTRMRGVGMVERLLPGLGRLGLHWFQNRLQNAANSFAAIRRELQRGRFDVVEMPECGGEGAILNHFLDLPTVVRLHSPAELIMASYPSKASDRMLTAMVERLGMTGARALSACSSWLAQEVRRRGLTDRPITVIPNGIDLSVFDQDEGIDIHERFGVPRDRCKIFFANRLEQRKGIHVVRDMLVPVLEKHPEVVFVLAGADPDALVTKELQPMLDERGLGGRLFHLGRLPLQEVRACLKQCEIFLLPSIWENAPYSLLEAMSAGKAIVASDCGGVPEMVRHEIDGIVAHTGDALSFVRAIARLQSPSLRARLGQSARARVEARFTDDHVARRSLEFYQWALGAPLGEPHAMLTRPGIELQPNDWFQAWWLRGVDKGEPASVGSKFDELGLDELAFVHAVSARVYWSQRGRGDTQAVAYLERLTSLHRQRATAAQQGGSGEPLVSGRLGLPALSHPLFDDDSGVEAMLGELWRLGDHELVTDWLARETAAPDFGERANRRMGLRRLALEAFRRRPDEHTAAVLRRIYRAVGTSPRVVQQDQEFIANHSKGAELGALIAEFGLHAPLRRPAVFAPARRRQKAAKSDVQVTVLIPAYRHEQFIAAAIESVLAQTHSNLRVLVVDDCSPDGTVAAAEAIDDARVLVRRNAHNLGLGGSILAALPTIETPYVALLNSDDVFHPERLEQCLALLESDPGAALIATKIAIMDDKERRLSIDNSCVLDQGIAAHGWVRWYDRVTTQLEDEQWTALPSLLRHNHLATSSNVVCRTSFLREEADAIAPLKYCLDWSLFLHASLAGSLRLVPEPLIGYRLHANNTVWFDEGARPGYLHEVNAVVAAALRRHAEGRRAAGAAVLDIAEEVAGLLMGSVSAHGETDGLALFLAEVLADAGSVPASFRSPELVHMAQQALLARKPTGDAVAQQRQRRDRHAIEALSRRNGELEPLVGRLRAQVANDAASRQDDLAYRQQLDAARGEVDEHHAQQQVLAARLSAAGAELANERAALAKAHDDLAARDAELSVAAQEALVARDAQQRELAALRAAQAEVQRLQVDVSSAMERCASLQAEGEAVRDQLRAAEDQLRAAEDELRAAEGVLRTTQAELHACKRHVDHLDTLIAAAHVQQRRTIEQASQEASLQAIERRDQLAEVERSFEFRVGRFLTHKLHLMGPLKAAACAWTATRIGAARVVGGLRKSLPGRKPARIVFACDDAFPAADSGRLAGELIAVLDAGFDARAVCMARGSMDWVSVAMQSVQDHRVVLSREQALIARDRRFFLRRNAEAVRAIEQFPAPAGWAAQVFPFARSARSLSAACLHAVGLGRGALAAWGAWRLLGVHFLLRLERTDLPRLSEPGWGDLACAANALLVDSDAMAARVREVLGEWTPSLLVVSPLLRHSLEPGDARLAGRFLCVGPFADSRGLLLLADAVKVAVDAGADVRFAILGADLPSVANLTAIKGFRSRLAEHGLLERFDFRGNADPTLLAGALARSLALVDANTGAGADVPGPTPAVVAAMAAGRPVIGFEAALAGVVRDGVEGRVVADGDAEVFGDALSGLLQDASLRERVGTAARRTFVARFSIAVVRAEFCARIRALLNARS